MKPSLALLLGAGLLLCGRALQGAETAAVGKLGDPGQFNFQGNSSFTSEEIKSGLLMNPDFLIASHSMAPLSNFVATVRRKILLGYQSAGFPDAQVVARVDDQSERIVVQIKEGRRYRMGDIKVTGARTVSVPPLIRRLTEPYRPEAVTQIGEESAQVKATPARTRYLDGEGQEVKPQPALWKKGDWASFDAGSLHHLAHGVTNALRDFGLMFPAVAVAIVPGSADAADLEVHILDEGPQGVLKEIELRGNKLNSRDAILKHLDLKPGLAVTRELISQLEQRLWLSGRFLKYTVTPVLIPKEENQFKLTLDLLESQAAPLLGQDLSREQKAFLRARDWLLGAAMQTDDLVFNFSGTNGFPAGFGAVLSSRGLGFLLEDSQTNLSLALLLTPEQGALYAPRTKQRLIVPTQFQIIPSLSVLPTAQGKSAACCGNAAGTATESSDQAPFNLSLVGGFQTRKPGEEAFRADLLLAPVAFLSITNSVQWQGNVLTITNGETLHRIDGDSGRLLELTSGSATDAWAQLSFERGAFERVTSRLQPSATNLHNAYVSERPVSSAIGFMLGLLVEDPFLSSWPRSGSNAPGIFSPIALRREVSLSQRARTAAVLRNIFDNRALEPLDDLAHRGFQIFSNSFPIPLEHPAIATPAMNGMIAMLAGVVFKFSNDLFPHGSWPWVLAHEAVFVAGGQTQYTDAELKRLLASNQTGPIGFLATSKLLSHFNSSAAAQVAAAGLDTLGVADFRKDCRLLLEGTSGASLCFSRLANALAQLSEEDVQSLGAVLPQETAELLRASVRSLRGRKGQPLTEALGPVLDQYWERTLKPTVASALRRTAQQAGEISRVESDFLRGMKYFEGQEVNFSQSYVAAVKFFREAAKAGHSGAQYMLAKCYEKGYGLDADIKEAINWYEAAGRQGHLDAQTTLANLYTDGFNIPRDDVKALTWFMVAAANGHKPSEVFMRSMQRKMTSDQITTAFTQAAQVLTNAPAAIRAHLGK